MLASPVGNNRDERDKGNIAGCGHGPVNERRCARGSVSREGLFAAQEQSCKVKQEIGACVCNGEAVKLKVMPISGGVICQRRNESLRIVTA